MSETYQFKLPLVQPSQSQKHVTVNEALARLDAMAQLRLSSVDTATPPLNPVDGEAYAVPIGASAGWEPFENQLVIWSNGGWETIQPKIGWRAWVEDANAYYSYVAGAWRETQTHQATSGAASNLTITQVTHTITPGAMNSTGVLIPSHSVVCAVTARVSQALVTDGATGWKLGVVGASGRYGSGYGLDVNSYAIGVTGQPQAYYSDTEVLIEPESGGFVSGEIKLAVHLLTITPPDPV